MNVSEYFMKSSLSLDLKIVVITILLDNLIIIKLK